LLSRQLLLLLLLLLLLYSVVFTGDSVCSVSNTTRLPLAMSAL